MSPSFANSFDAAWCAWYTDDGGIVPRPTAWRTTVARFESEVSVPDMEEAIEIAMQKPLRPDGAWPYFLGIMRNMARQRPPGQRRGVPTDYDDQRALMETLRGIDFNLSRCADALERLMPCEPLSKDALRAIDGDAA